MLRLAKKNRTGIIYILETLCLTGVLMFLQNMGDELYQTMRNLWVARGVCLFVIYMFIIQRVHLFNWQSLVASLVYLPIGYLYGTRYYGARDLFRCDAAVALSVWVLILIVVDMTVYKKVNQAHKFRKTMLAMYALMAFLMAFCRNGRTDPIIFPVFFVFYFIPLDRERWKRIIYQFCTAWILCFGYRFVYSMIKNPEVAKIGRWYGCFLNIGDFGVFMVAVVVVLLYMMLFIKTTYGRKSISYVAAAALMVPVIWTVFRVCTITMFIGIGCALAMCFIILKREVTARRVVIRSAAVLISIPILVMCGLLFLRMLTLADKKYWVDVLKNGSTFMKPIADLIRRAHSVFDRARTFADCGVFEEGTLINYLDLVTSGRLSLIKSYAKYFGVCGTDNIGLQVGTFYAYGTHTTYTQFIFEYGYVGGGMFLIWFAYSIIQSIKQYLRSRKIEDVLLCIWLAMAAGVFLGEMIYLVSPIIFFTMILIYPLMIKIEK